MSNNTTELLPYLVQQHNLNSCASGYWYVKEHDLWRDMAISAVTIRDVIDHFFEEGVDYCMSCVETRIGDTSFTWEQMEVIE